LAETVDNTADISHAVIALLNSLHWRDL